MTKTRRLLPWLGSLLIGAAIGCGLRHFAPWLLDDGDYVALIMLSIGAVGIVWGVVWLVVIGMESRPRPKPRRRKAGVYTDGKNIRIQGGDGD